MLKGKSAIVTGSTSGIGRGIAAMLAREGANVMINGFGDVEEIEQLRQQLGELSAALCIYSAADMTKTVALECAEFGVTINAISPGYVLTPLVENQIPATAKARNISEDDVMLANQPTKKFISIEEIGDVARFLCSSGASSITGVNISIDGGWTAA